jgi:hypothetical protein
VSRRIPVSIAFWLLTGAGLTAPAAIELLNDEIESGALRLWRDGVVVSREHFLRYMRIGRYPNLPYFAVIVVPKEAWQRYPVFELEEDQARGLIMKLIAPKPPRRKSTGRRPMYPWETIDPLINSELKRGTENVAAVVRAVLVERKIAVPSTRQMQGRVERLRARRDAR